uniref:Class S F-box protein n=1 Tax=Nicotiana alata TaxID=4087 RepID=A9XI05_NICAL|nr:class S F-box protein [Nicotiana alata]
MMLDGIMKKLPEDVVIYILSRFSVKSLLRFKFISKSWYTLIQSSTFINVHLNRSTITKNEFILFSRSFRIETEGFKNVLSIISSDDYNDLNVVLQDLDLPYLTFTPNYHFNELVGPCNGLIVLTDDDDIIVLFNPATKNYMLLPPSPFVCSKGYHRSFIGGVGFGFDSIGNDYKFVRISEVFLDTYWGPEEREQKVEVYDLRSDSWRDLNHVDQQLPTIFWNQCFEMLHNGAFHWYAVGDLTYEILCFDFSTEIFRSMKMPESCNAYDGKRYSLAVVNESLTLICYPSPDSEIDQTQNTMDIWIMMEYGVNESWTKKYIISPLPIESPLTIWRDHLLLLQSKTGQLISYNLRSNEVKEFDLRGYPESLRAIVYKESLISVPKTKTRAW